MTDYSSSSLHKFRNWSACSLAYCLITVWSGSGTNMGTIRIVLTYLLFLNFLGFWWICEVGKVKKSGQIIISVIFGQIRLCQYTDLTQPVVLTFGDLWRSLKVNIFIINVIYSSILFEWFPYLYHSCNIQIWPIFQPVLLSPSDL